MEPKPPHYRHSRLRMKYLLGRRAYTLQARYSGIKLEHSIEIYVYEGTFVAHTPEEMVIFKATEPYNTFPSDELKAKLMLLSL